MIDEISQWILSLLIVFPVLAALLILMIPGKDDSRIHRHIAMGATVLELIFSLHLLAHFVPNTAQFQFSQIETWLPKSTGIKYIVGVDGINLILVLLSTIFCAIVMMTTYTSLKTKVKGFLALFLLLESAIIGVFVSVDVVLFYVFWELSLIPVYFMIGIWGGKDRIYATLKLFIYGVIGSLLMLVALIYLYFAHANANGGVYSSNILDLYVTAAALPFNTQMWLFLAVTLAFGIKVPIFPFHTWLPDTYEQAPATYTLMSGVILKLATYGLIRFSLCLFPSAAIYFAKPIMILAVIGILYGALIAWKQTNIRRIMAFSSLSHLGFIVIGIFSLNTIGLQGSLYQMLNHAITAGALFILFNILYERRGSFELDDFGGIAKVLPWYAFFFVIAAMGSVALPSTGSFIGEWLILIGSFQANPVLGSLATLGVIFGAVYILWATYKILFGPLTKEENKKIIGMHKHEVFQLTVLSILIFVLGFASAGILDHTKPTLVNIERSIKNKSAYSSELANTHNGILMPISKFSSEFKQGVK
ncbi:complex I subunit 4 family protein [Fluviispira multicolorata]|uniref:NADH-quinone oxidoreductase subunit M n=1 Tax=Fluviispira multicolorata TaxID=2654512 RepID=A0A833N5Q4_9BACT|nr:NADH-quinone oxidoreductase subunit M [Fluviispira multicolorata]KAB8028445.1 NADH-quinone oxidoreductase subunit M [Fluviispira multicolorata]